MKLRLMRDAYPYVYPVLNTHMNRSITVNLHTVPFHLHTLPHVLNANRCVNEEKEEQPHTYFHYSTSD